MPVLDRVDAVHTVPEEACRLFSLAQVFHECVTQWLHDAGGLQRLETGDIRLAHGPRAVEAQLEGRGLALRHEGDGGEIVKDDLTPPMGAMGPVPSLED